MGQKYVSEYNYYCVTFSLLFSIHVRGAFGKFEKLSDHSHNIHSKTKRSPPISISTYPL